MAPAPAADSDSPRRQFDAILVLSFGGPDRAEEVMPFLENVLRGRNVPRERMLEVAEHYYHCGGASPINAQNRALIAALVTELNQRHIELPVYWGNRNWHPLLPDTLRQMADDGIQNALAFVTSAFSSYSGCRQYLENIAAAQAEVGPTAPAVEKLRSFFHHPGYVEAVTDRIRETLVELPVTEQARVPLIFTAHSIPLGMAETCAYEAQLYEACRLVGERFGRTDWQIAYQSRSGPPSQPWLEPDIGDTLRGLAGARPGSPVVVVPIGFISDHMEVVYDLDTEASALCEELGLDYHRAQTVGTHARFVTMIRELIEERLSGTAERASLGNMPSCPDVCPADCCRYTPQRPAKKG